MKNDITRTKGRALKKRYDDPRNLLIWRTDHPQTGGRKVPDCVCTAACAQKFNHSLRGGQRAITYHQIRNGTALYEESRKRLPELPATDNIDGIPCHRGNLPKTDEKHQVHNKGKER
jgi:hypothetical protein